jgi:hypothetical protein
VQRSLEWLALRGALARRQAICGRSVRVRHTSVSPSTYDIRR